ncbi:putative LRR receptor-like serine/threonine-protein kinase [Acorus calamus]|uniref:LRR receptor-like serine/threonine-protein kinase n=1 Tax=Acorus calamus TaxID=4465 RepID=A0AAV9EKN7_ACOCL|nr:putative LRR receptor-like serine/threonine-protein kinase [Acorus calamus]
MSCSCFNVILSTRKKGHSFGENSEGISKHIRFFSYKDLRLATDNFHASNEIGRGGYGTVYKGILKDGTQVAMKALSAESRQGINEFLTEIHTISNVRHPNLVELIGCCIEGVNRILVYEFAENSSLDQALLGPQSGRATLDWKRRSAICVGTARGLAFLHEEIKPHIVHRDIKASNILLSQNFTPKIGDFGMAKLFQDNITHISTRIAGTIGYLAPEYARLGQLTKKADVYSFGVLVLEIVSGRSNAGRICLISGKPLLEWTWQLYGEGRLHELVDSDLGEYPEDEVLRYIKVALFCTQASAQRRPSMIQVVDMLSKRIRLNEKQLTPPSFIQDFMDIGGGSTATKSSGSQTSGVSSSTSSNPVSSFQIFPR